MSDIKKLKQKLFTRRDSGGKVLSEQELQNSENFSVNYKKFLDISKTEREAVDYVLTRAKKLGFTEFDNSKKYNPGDKIYFYFCFPPTNSFFHLPKHMFFPTKTKNQQFLQIYSLKLYLFSP